MDSFEKEIFRQAYGKDLRKIFDDFLDFSINILGGDLGKDRLEDNLKLLELYGESAEKLNEEKGIIDYFGYFYERNISLGHNGQFFTPTPVAKFMNEIIGPSEKFEEYQRIIDPTCGSGVMLLSAISKYNLADFWGCDLNLTCVKMACLQFATNMRTIGHQGFFIHMNSLSGEVYGGYVVRVKFGFPYITKIPESDFEKIKEMTFGVLKKEEKVEEKQLTIL